MTNTIIKDNLDRVTARIAAAANRVGRSPNAVRLVVVGKTQPVDLIADTITAGATIIGENYIQEARTKFDALSHHRVQWHFIGHLQSNKAKYAIRMFDLIHTVDTMKLAVEIDNQAGKAGKVQQVLLQVNISGETSKSGVTPEGAVTLAKEMSPLKHLRIQGLMTMPPFFDAPEEARPYFAALRGLRDQIASKGIANVVMTELSMGMTGDFEVAIEEGATMVRIGTALFGERL